MSNEQNERQHKVEVLSELEPIAEQLLADHQANYKEWHPSDLIPSQFTEVESDQKLLSDMRSNSQGISDPVRVALALHTLTEEGLPHFHRLLSRSVGHDNAWERWNYHWTAEEDRHGCVLRDYIRDTGILNLNSLEKLQFEYLQSGFNPKWAGCPYKVFAFTTIQERATQVSHKNTAVAVKNHEPVLQKILSYLAGDEWKHHLFYRSVLDSIMKVDPVGALEAMADVFPAIDMPGHMITGFGDIMDVERMLQIYGPREYVAIVKDMIEHFQIASLTGLCEKGTKLQEKILKIPARLTKVANYLDSKCKKKSFSFSLVYNREFVLELQESGETIIC